MALLAAAATSTMASEGTGTPAENAGAQDSAQQDGPTTPSPDAKKPKSGTGSTGPDAGAKDSDELTEITVTGVRQSQIRAIELKRLAPSIQDSISAESIGQLPDVTITDSLQRITGVQINRDAGVGTSVDVRGLPQVGTMMNGEVFISPDQIDSQQPDFTTLPATLFNQVDVIKSSTASQTESGISGAINLHTNRRGICRMDSPIAITPTQNGEAPLARLDRRRAVLSHTMAMVHGACWFPGFLRHHAVGHGGRG